jgi:hypothetical protein
MVVGGVVKVGVGGVVATGVATAGAGGEDGSAAPRCAAHPATARAPANAKMVMVLTGRIATSPKDMQLDPFWDQQHERGPAWSRHSDGRASRQVRNGFGPVAIVDRNEHDAQCWRGSPSSWPSRSAAAYDRSR